jgi:hypothetical protein
VSRKTRPVMCPGDRALSGRRAGCRRMPFLGHAPDREPASGSRSVPHAAADSRDVLRAVGEQLSRGHIGHGAAVGVTGAVSDEATPDGAKQTTTAFVT